MAIGETGPRVATNPVSTNAAWKETGCAESTAASKVFGRDDSNPSRQRPPALETARLRQYGGHVGTVPQQFLTESSAFSESPERV